jgi:hypothetical protein
VEGVEHFSLNKYKNLVALSLEIVLLGLEMESVTELMLAGMRPWVPSPEPN